MYSVCTTSIGIYLFIIVYLCKTIEAGTLDCDFDLNFCGWKNDTSDDFDWKRKSGYTVTGYTGPKSDHTTGNGLYVYIEAYGKYKGAKSRIISPTQLPGQYCLTFWYNMYGRDIGALNVYLAMNGNETVIFTKQRDIGNRNWWKSVINMRAAEPYQIIFEGVVGGNSEGDIAIDDISIKSGPCSIDCNFDVDLCNWMQAYDDNFDWIRDMYSSYIEVRNKQGSATIVSPLQNGGKFCLSFMYFMYGSSYDRLQLQLWTNDGSNTNISSYKSEGSQYWIHITKFISSRNPFQIVFEGQMHWYFYEREMAINEVKLSQCQDCANPKPDHGNANSTNFEYGSVIKIKCEHGYNLQGPSLIMCESNGQWSGTTICKPHDCGDFAIQNGLFVTPDGTTFGKTGRQECITGFVLIGERSITCTVNGWSNTSTYCKIIDCGNLAIQNGTFITPNGTTFGQVATQECDTGFVLIGEPDIKCTVKGWSNTSALCELIDCENLAIPNGTFITPNGTTFGQVGRQECDTGFVLSGEPGIKCTVNGWSDTSAYCKIIDCENLVVQNGTFITPNGTTFGQVGRQECETGFDLIGEPDIKCTVKGWSNTSAYCKIIGTENLDPYSSPLVAVYILPPVAVVVLAVLITVVYLRRRHPNCIKIFRTANQSKNAPTETSRNGKAHSNQMYNNEAVQPDDEYATIEDQNKDDSMDTVYYAKVKKKITKKPDQAYAKGVNKAVEEIDQNMFNSYDVLNTEDLSSRKENDTTQDPDYDSTCTGKMSSISFNHDDYSHLGDLNTENQHPLHLGKQTNLQEDTNYSHIDRVNTKSRLPKHLQGNNANVIDHQNSTVKDKKMTEERSSKFKTYRDEKAEYYNVDTEMEDTGNKSLFIIQETDQTCENGGFENHDYFILEKT